MTQMNTRMPESLKDYYQVELREYQERMDEKEYATAWRHLERAHVIGQAYPWEHSYAHWKMLLFGFTIKSPREILGQIPRLLVGGVKSFVGKVPTGNTGGANIPPLRVLPIEADIREVFLLAGLKVPGED